MPGPEGEVRQEQNYGSWLDKVRLQSLLEASQDPAAGLASLGTVMQMQGKVKREKRQRCPGTAPGMLLLYQYLEASKGFEAGKLHSLNVISG